MHGLFFLASLLLLDLTASHAQIGPSPAATNTPNYGIYGSAPTPGTCGTPVWAILEDYPEVEGGLYYKLPLNGLGNFNFWYTYDGNGFLSGGSYKVTYRNLYNVNCYGTGDLVTNPPYSPNSAHTNGRQVRPFNLAGGYYTTPFGIHGIALAQIPGRGGATAPLENASANAGHNDYYFPYKSRTNGIGWFSIYYTSLTDNGFILRNPSNYFVRITGNYMGCNYMWTSPEFLWLADWGAIYEVDLGTISIASTDLGCQP